MSLRRRWFAVGAGLAAAAAGSGIAVWRGLGVGAAAAHPVFALRFPRPDGSVLDMGTLLGRPLLLNFWATWCPPCVREMPLLDTFRQAQASRGWQVVGLAVDGAAPVREFLHRHPVAFDIGLAGFDGVSLSRALGNQEGGLPFTAWFDAAGRLQDRHIGELSPGDLDQWAAKVQANRS